MKIALITLLLWLVLVAFGYVMLAHGYDVGDYNKFMGDQVYSVYMERSNLDPYNAEMDKSLGIQIDLLCNARERTPKQCWNMMLYVTGNEYTPYKGF